MADLTALDDVSHYIGADLQLSPTGDLARVNRAERSRQRVLRRLISAVKGYLFHPDYGGGLPQKIGTLVDLAKIKGLIRGQMLLEASVQQQPGPNVVVREIVGGAQVQVSYTSLPDRQPVSLKFDVTD